MALVVNPARAGMIRRHIRDAHGHISKPRASGDDPIGHNPFFEAHM